MHKVETALKALANPRRAKASAHILNTPDVLLGIPVPKQRKVMASVKNDMTLNDWDHLLRTTKYHEAKNVALIGATALKETLTLKDWPMIKSWVDYANSWELSDRLAGIIAHLHEQSPTKIYSTLKSWNTSKDPWKQRLSMTSLFLYSALRKKQPSWAKAKSLVAHHLNSPDSYVQKGCGWTLREAFNVYPKEVTAFIDKHACDMAATTFSYATEKMKKSVKAAIKCKRKEARQKGKH